MKSKRSQLEKLYKEWEFSRTINWNEPDGDTDTEEVTPRRSSLRSGGHNPWDEDIYVPTPRPTPIRRRGSTGNGFIDGLRATPNSDRATLSSDRAVTSLDDTISQLLGDTNTGIPSNRFGFNSGAITSPPQSEQFISRGDRNDPENVIRVVRDNDGVNRPLRFTVSSQGRPVVEERPISDEQDEQTPANDVVGGSFGTLEPDTSADGVDQEDTSANGTPQVNWVDSVMEWTTQAQTFNWDYHRPWGINTRYNAGGTENTDDGNQ